MNVIDIPTKESGCYLQVFQDGFNKFFKAGLAIKISARAAKVLG